MVVATHSPTPVHPPTQAPVLTSALTFQAFLEQCPEDGRYELVDGKIIDMRPLRAHQNIARFLVKQFDREAERLGLGYIVDKDIVLRTLTATGMSRGRMPDVTVVAESVWNADVMTYGALTVPPQLVVEVVSTNWEDDYVDKLEEYDRLGIAEYWIVDYLAIASRHHLGNPKQPSIFVYHKASPASPAPADPANPADLSPPADPPEPDEALGYSQTRFQGDSPIVSPTFPELALTAAAIIAAAGPNASLG